MIADGLLSLTYMVRSGNDVAVRDAALVVGRSAALGGKGACRPRERGETVPGRHCKTPIEHTLPPTMGATQRWCTRDVRWLGLTVHGPRCGMSGRMLHAAYILQSTRQLLKWLGAFVKVYGPPQALLEPMRQHSIVSSPVARSIIGCPCIGPVASSHETGANLT
jgi:hypothetical protein